MLSTRVANENAHPNYRDDLTRSYQCIKLSLNESTNEANVLMPRLLHKISYYK